VKSTLQLRLLGAPEVLVDGSPVTDKLPGKAQAILYYLAAAGQPQPRTVLATLLWGDVPESAARTNLRKALVGLRRELDAHLQIERQSVAFHSETDLWVDAVEFQTILADASTEVDPERLQTAIDLYQGDFLTGFYVRHAPDFETWMYAEQGRLRELMIQALHTLATHFAEEGDLSQGIATVRRLLTLEPWREEAHRQLMLLLAQDGQRGAALAQYETCRQVLAEELSVEPGPETVALYEQIRAGKLSRDAALTGGFAQGQRRRADTVSSASLPPRSSAPPPSLPGQATPFVGREKELADIIRRLTDRDCRLLTLVGPGGIGKTRLALQTAERFVETGTAQDFFPHGLVFVSLAGVSSTSGLVSAIAEAANFSFYSSISPRQQLLDYLREKKLLLVLDNLEHVLAAGTELIADILAAAPAVKILATSREVLNLQEAWFHPVQGMPFPEADPQPADGDRVDPQATGPSLESYDAVQLFVQSAGRARVDFSLAAEQTHVVRICQLVEGMPLAIELAAAWLKMLPAEKIAREIERSLDFLATRHQNVPERQRSIRAVFEHSWQLLRAEEREALKRLSVFRGSFTEEAAGQVAGASLPVLAVLVEKSLLRVTQSGRYQLHELLRQFAAEKLAEDSATELATRERHSRYYLDFLKARAEMLTGQAQPAAVAEISREIDNVRPAWLWAVQQNNLPAILQTLHGYFDFYLIRSRFQEGEEGLGYLLDHLHQSEDLHEHPDFKPVRARALARRSALCYSLGKYDSARQYAEEGLAVGLEAGCQSDVAFAQIVLGVVAGWQGQKEVAEEWLTQSLALSREIGDQENLADALHELAQIHSSFGDYAEAKRLAQESLAVSRAYGRPDWIAHALVILGWAIVCLGEYAEAEACYREALAIFESLGNRHGAAGALDGLGWVAWCQGGEHLEQASQYYDQSLAMMRESGHRRLMAQTLCDLAILANEQADFARAKAISQEGMRLAEALDSPVYRVPYLCCLGSAACGQGDYVESRRYLSEALRMAYDTQLWPPLTFILFEFAGLLARESELPNLDQQAGLQKKALALELLAFVNHHPATWQAVKDRAAQLQSQLESGLPPNIAATATSRGKNQSLAEVVEMLVTSPNKKRE